MISSSAATARCCFGRESRSTDGWVSFPIGRVLVLLEINVAIHSTVNTRCRNGANADEAVWSGIVRMQNSHSRGPTIDLTVRSGLIPRDDAGYRSNCYD